MFEGWDSFYILIGGAAGALIGLLFVVATLTGGRDPSTVSRGARVYITPIVFHFAVVLLISAVAMVPGLRPWMLSIFLAALAAVGIVYSAKTTKNLFDGKWSEQPDLSDKCFYGVFPTLAYICLGGAAYTVWVLPKAAVYGLSAILLGVLLIGIRNAWDLATALAQRPPGTDATAR